MKTLTELAAEARRINEQMGDGFDYAIYTTAASILAIESEVTALRERLAAAEADAERYRWLRDYCRPEYSTVETPPRGGQGMRGRCS